MIQCQKEKENKILETIKEFAGKLPRFPDGRIDYSNSDKAPVIDILIKHENKVLLLKRSKKVLNYPEKWNVVSGYFDEIKTIRQKALEEIKEELDVEEDNISAIQTGEPYSFIDAEINKTWIIHPVLVELKKPPDIKLDWEHSEYKWITPEELEKFDIVPNIKELFRKFIPHLS